MPVPSLIFFDQIWPDPPYGVMLSVSTPSDGLGRIVGWCASRSKRMTENVTNIEEFAALTMSFCPALRQLESMDDCASHFVARS